MKRRTLRGGSSVLGKVFSTLFALVFLAGGVLVVATKEVSLPRARIEFSGWPAVAAGLVFSILCVLMLVGIWIKNDGTDQR